MKGLLLSSSNLAISATLGLALLVSSPVVAQTQPPADGTRPAASATPPAPASAVDPAAATGASGTGEIIVTAQRRAESLERVPVSVTALGGSALAERSVTTEQDLQRSVPGLTVQTTEYSNQFSFAIRGQGIDTFSGGLAAVVPYVNDVQVISGGASAFYDLESVQVLKGPQGTLFGRNATGGAVLYTTAKPTQDFGGFVNLSAGNYSYREASGAINIPVIGDSLLIRVAGDLKHRDGFQYNSYYDQENGRIASHSGRITVQAKPVSGLTNTTVFQYEHDGGNNVTPVLYSANACGATNNGVPVASVSACLFSPLLDSTIGAPGAWAAYLAQHPNVPEGGVLAYLAEQKALGPWKGSFDDRSSHRGHNYSLINTLTYDLTSDIQFKNITGYAHAYAADGFDADGTPFGLLTHNDFFGPGQDGHDIVDRTFWSNESQLIGNGLGGNLKYILGAYFGHDRTRNEIQQSAFALQPIIQPTPEAFFNKILEKTQAVFFQATYDVGDLTGLHGLSVTGGFRQTWEQVGLTQLPGSNFYGFPHEQFNQSKPSWTVGLQYQANHDLMFYVTHRGSWRAGGFNGTGLAVDATAPGGGNKFLPETTWDVEAGAKYHGRVGGMDTRLNVAVYRQWIRNVQRTDYITFNGALNTLTVNVPSARVSGVEVDGEIRPVPWFSIGGNLAYTNAKYTDPVVSVFGTTTVFGPYGATPKWAGSLYGQIEFGFVPSDWGKLSLRVDAYAQSKQYFSNLGATFNPNSALPGYKLVNLRAQWSNVAQTGLDLSAFITNVANKAYFVGGTPTGSSLGVNTAGPGMPRMFGVQLGYKF